MSNPKLYFKFILPLSVLGLVSSIYLVMLHFSPELSDVCKLGESFDCDKVNKSSYSEIFGIPVAILGALYYILITVISSIFLFKDKLLSNVNMLDLFNALFFITTIGLLFSVYLTYHEAFTLKTYCIFCVVQQIAILIIWCLQFRLVSSHKE